jgi:hypothetical protein
VSESVDPARDIGVSPLFEWRRRICESDLKAVTRHVALVLSMHMNDKGGSCWPSISTVARETGLSERCVRASIGELCDKSTWLKVSMGGGRGNPNRYTAVIPNSAPHSVNDVPGGDESRHDATRNTAPDDTKVGTTCRGGRHEGVSNSSSSEEEESAMPVDIVHAAAMIAAHKALLERKSPDPVVDRLAWLATAAGKWKRGNQASIDRYRDSANDASTLHQLVEADSKAGRKPIRVRCDMCRDNSGIVYAQDGSAIDCDCRKRRTA